MKRVNSALVIFYNVSNFLVEWLSIIESADVVKRCGVYQIMSIFKIASEELAL
jgi:hypothetical protein